MISLLSKVAIRHMDEEVGEMPGWESVTIRLHMPAAEAGYQVKDYDLLPTLLGALAVATLDPRLEPEEQCLLEACRMEIVQAMERGGELPPMRFTHERINPSNAILRCHVYVPKKTADRSRIAQQCKQGISLANEVARSSY